MANEELHNGLPELLSLDNMANGAVYEMVDDAIKRMAANIGDVNTEPTQQRKITISIIAKPYKDRSGAELSIKVDNKLAGLKPADGMMHIARVGGEYLAFGRSTKQTEIEFNMSPDAPAPDGKSKPAN